MTIPTLKIGLLLKDKVASKYVFELVHWAAQQPNIEISHFIINNPCQSSTVDIIRKNGLYHYISLKFFQAIISIEKKFIKLYRLHRDHFDSFNINEMVIGSTTKQLQLNSDISNQLSPIDLINIKSLNLDLLINCNVEAIQGEILNASRLGIISISGGGSKVELGDHACFWECYYRHPKTGFTIKNCAAEFDSADVLLSGFFSTKFTFSLNQANLYKKSSPIFHDFLLKIAMTGQLPKAAINNRHSEKILQLPKLHHSMIYLLKVAYRLIVKIIYHAIHYQKKWGLSFIHSNWRRAALWRSSIVDAPKGHFWADPFMCTHNDKTYCFFEDYVYKTDLGHIAVVEVGQNAVTELGACIKEPFHLSFPFLFNYQGKLFMCPESSASRQIRVYQCNQFPLEWELSTVIMDDVSAADTMLFEHAGKWWMLTSMDQSGANDYCSALYLFYSDSPLSTNWHAHPSNPLRIDSDGGRNAGLILEDGKIFRIAQRQGYDQYGEGILIYEVTELSELVYSEQLFSEINPSFRKGILGTHHLSTAGEVTVFDHVSYSLFP